MAVPAVSIATDNATSVVTSAAGSTCKVVGAGGGRLMRSAASKLLARPHPPTLLRPPAAATSRAVPCMDSSSPGVWRRRGDMAAVRTLPIGTSNVEDEESGDGVPTVPSGERSKCSASAKIRKCSVAAGNLSAGSTTAAKRFSMASSSSDLAKMHSASALAERSSESLRRQMASCTSLRKPAHSSRRHVWDVALSCNACCPSASFA
mmetsp:Transcript_7799/g.16303  ORF Transcript_7799/g.16303 Transcript_7799/m.16303 type:complete len:206 (+) Transcript_7799:281-898(+)